MTPKQLLNRVQIEADARLSDVVERLLFILEHPPFLSESEHLVWKWEKTGLLADLDVEGKSFIRTTYTDSKIALHQIKRRFDYYDAFFSANENDVFNLARMQESCIHHQNIVYAMKAKKFDMLKDVL